LVGGAATLAIKGKEWSSQWSPWEAFLVLVSFICAAVSYYGVYIAHIAILGMVNAGTIYVFEERLYTALHLQYNGTLLGLFSLGLAFTRMLEKRA